MQTLAQLSKGRAAHANVRWLEKSADAHLMSGSTVAAAITTTIAARISTPWHRVIVSSDDLDCASMSNSFTRRVRLARMRGSNKGKRIVRERTDGCRGSNGTRGAAVNMTPLALHLIQRASGARPVQGPAGSVLWFANWAEFGIHRASPRLQIVPGAREPVA